VCKEQVKPVNAKRLGELTLDEVLLICQSSRKKDICLPRCPLSCIATTDSCIGDILLDDQLLVGKMIAIEEPF
jgi:hypothetical protein